MKYITAILFLILVIPVALAQQSRKTDDALLLDLYQNQRFNEAFAYLKSIYKEPVIERKELATLAYAASMSGKLPEAENFYQRILVTDTANKAVLFNLAGINKRRGNNAKAELYYRKIAGIDTTNFSVYNNLAQLSHDKGDLTSQLYFLQKANKLNPTDGDIAADLSNLYVNLKQFAVAEKILKQAIAADAENIVLQQSLLKLSYAQNKWAETITTGEQLLILGDSTTATIAKLGRAYYQTKNYKCGIAILTALPEIAQNETTAYLAAICYKQLRDHKSAIVEFEHAIKLSVSANTGTYYNEMADSYETLNQFKTAKAKYEKGLLYDESPLAYYYLANLYETRLKDKKNALKYFKKYLAGKPSPEKQKDYIAYAQSRVSILGGK